MKLRRFIAMALALALIVTNSPIVAVNSAETGDQNVSAQAEVTLNTVTAYDDTKVTWSAAVRKPTNQAFLERNSDNSNFFRQKIIDDSPYIDSLVTDAIGQFNKDGEEWTWMSYKVSVPAAGEYTLGMSVVNSGQTNYKIPLCVDGQVRTLSYTAKNQDQTAKVTLPAGEHVVVAFMPMPQNATEAGNKEGWEKYTWVCVDGMLVDDRLTLLAAPTETEVEECFSTTYKAGDQNYVTRNKYNDNGDTLGSSNRDGLKNNRVSVATLVAKGVKNAAYAALTVYAPEAGEYGIHAMVTTDAKLTSDQVALVVDGKQAVAVPIAKSDSLQRIQTNVTLAAGVHTILITSPMPLTDEEAQAIPAGNTDGWAGMNGKYRWMDFSEIIVDSRLAVAKVATDPTVTRIEADDTGYVVGGTKVSYADASFGAAVELKVNSKQLVAAAQKYNGSTLMQMDWGKLSAARFAVKGEGTQSIKLDVIAACASGNESDAVPTVYVYVNGRIYEKTLSAWNTKETVTIDAALTGGVDVVKVFAAADAVSDGTRVLFDAVLLDNAKLTAVAVADMDAKTVVSFGDTSKVLINKFNNVTSTQAGGADLGDTRYSKYYIDGLRGEQLYRIPHVAVTVNAAKAGYYDISVAVENNTAADTSEQLALMVDGKVYTMRFNRASNATLCATVYLEQGAHMLVFTAAMPQDKATADTKNDSNQSKLYPWINFKNLTLDPGLTIGDKPGAGEVEYAEPWHSGFTIVDAGDESYVIANKYTDNGATLGGANSNALKENRVSLETLLENGLEIAPNASFFVIAPADGTYDIYATVQTDNKLTSGQVALVVDGTAVTAVTIKSQKDYQIIHAEVTLKKGAHTIALTSPMPLTDAEAQAIPAGETDGWVSMNGKYNWMNMIRFAIDGDLTVVKDATDSTTTGIEAEDETYVKYHGNYASQIFIGASAGFGVGGANTVIAPSLVPASGAKYVDWTKLSYVEFAVTGAAGEQEILLDLIATRADDNTTDAIPKVYVYVNGKVYEKTLTAWNTKETVTVKAELIEGINVVKFFAAAETVSNGTYVLFDAFSYDVGKLTAVTVAAVEASKTQNSFGNTEKVLTNKFGNVTASGIGNAQQGDARYSKYYIDGLNASQLPRIPYAAFTVNADKAGYYDISVVVSNNEAAGASEQLALMVDGKVYTMTFDKASEATLYATVYLDAGKHLLIITAPMPQDKATADTKDSSNESKLYPWIDMKSFTLDAGLTLAEKPDAGDMEYADVWGSVGTIVDAGNENYVTANRYTDNGATLGGANSNALKENRVSLETLLQKGVSTAPYASIFVVAPEDGTYDIYATVQVDNKLTSDQLALVVDGKQVFPVAVEKKGGSQVVHVSLTLTQGAHSITLTAPMPLTDAEAQAIPAGETDSWVGMNGKYRWMDIIRFGIDKDLVLETADTDSQTIPVQDTAKVSKNWSSYKDSGTDGVSDYLSAIMDDMRTHRTSIESLAGGDLTRVPYISITVTAPETGWYNVYADVMVNSKLTFNHAAMIVDGTTVYDITVAATGKQQMIGQRIQLTAGTHTILITAPMPGTDAEAQAVTDPAEDNWAAITKAYPWFNFYSFVVSDKLTVESGAENPLKDQSVLFVGDSITHSGDSWAGKIGTWNNMDWINAGINGATVSRVRAKIVLHQIMANAGKDHDYVIMHGGINDAMNEVPIGQVSDSWNVADFDCETYAGALETMFYYAYEHFDGAKLGYIINYATPNSKFGGKTANTDTKAYYDAAKKVCDKWGISYIDLYEGTVTVGGQELTYSYDILQVDTNAENFLGKDAKEIHLSDEGYRVISPYIEAWMKTLTVKTSPIPEKNSGKFVDAGDADKVLSGGFTASSGTLIDRINTGMAEDEANIKYLPHAKNMLGDWAFATIQVNAAQAGDYKIKVEMSAKNATQMGMLVDGQAYTLNYSKKDGFFQYMEQTVHLEAGTHYITFTAAMPETDNGLTGSAWNDYPWTNIASIVIDEGLEVKAAPKLADVTGKLSDSAPFYNRVEAEDKDYVIYNNYNGTPEKNEIASGGFVIGGQQRWIFEQSFEDLKTWLDAKHNSYIEYAVVAPEDGEYAIRVGFMAGAIDGSVAKPYIAVLVNGEVHKVQFTKNWNQIDKAELTVTLKKGLNIIRCTSYTRDQACYEARGWINHDFLDLDKRLTAVKHSALTVEAEDSKHFNKFKVQPGADYEKASGKVLGSADRKYVTGLELTLDKLTAAQLKQIPYFSVTVTAPQDGYYPVSVNMAADGRLPRGTIGVLVDGAMNVFHYARTDKTTTGAKVDALIYLSKGDHVLTFTIPMPASASVDANYSYYWCNFDNVTLYNGLTLAKTQKAPTTEADYVRVEVEDHAMFNMSINNGTASGNAYYRSSQTVAEMLKDGIDGTKTPYAQLVVNAKKAGTYTVYLGVTSGMTAGSTVDEVAAQFVIDVNGKLTAVTVQTSKTAYSRVIPVQLTLNAGENVIRLTHLGKDSQRGGTTWIDFDYMEMPAAVGAQLGFVESGETLEAEKGRYEGYSELVNQSYSDGRYLGDPNYDDVDESDVTFEKLDPADLGELPHVTYSVFAEKAGTYTLTVGFAAGMHHYTSAEIAEGAVGGFAVIVNGATKQLVEYGIASSNTKMSRLITVELQEGENEITFTTSLAEYIIDRMPRNDETYRLIWVDHDYLVLCNGLSGMSSEEDDYDVDDSDHDHAQITPKDPTADGGDDGDDGKDDIIDDGNDGGSKLPSVVWVLLAGAIGSVFVIFILLGKKRKEEKEKQKTRRF